MAYQRYQGYQYETSPRKLQPEYEPIKNPYQKKKSSVRKENITKSKSQTKKSIKEKRRAMMYIAVGFAILFAISYRNSLITENFNKKENLKENLSAIEKENEQLKINIENSLNLNNVEQSAKEKLGMQKLDNNQKVYVNLPKSDYIEAVSEEVIINDSTSWFQNILHKLTQIIK